MGRLILVICVNALLSTCPVRELLLAMGVNALLPTCPMRRLLLAVCVYVNMPNHSHAPRGACFGQCVCQSLSPNLPCMCSSAQHGAHEQGSNLGMHVL